jgi:hypothetical protein
MKVWLRPDFLTAIDHPEGTEQLLDLAFWKIVVSTQPTL